MALIDVRDLERTFVVRRKVDGGRRRLRDEVRAVHGLDDARLAAEPAHLAAHHEGAGKLRDLDQRHVQLPVDR